MKKGGGPHSHTNRKEKKGGGGWYAEGRVGTDNLPTLKKIYEGQPQD